MTKEITRIMLIGPGRNGEAAITLHFDHYLDPMPNNSIICHADPLVGFESLPNGFTAIHEEEIMLQMRQQKLIPSELAKDNARWIRQQLLKFWLLDTCDSEMLLINDCDSFRIKQHAYFDEAGLPILYYDDNYFYNNARTWGDPLGDILGISTKPAHMFVSEFMPILRADWLALRSALEASGNDHWLRVISKWIVNYAQEHRQGYVFNDFQFLGEWITHIRPKTKLVKQDRLWVDISNKRLPANPNGYNCLNFHGRNDDLDIQDTISQLSSWLNHAR